jgi:hypothetical protein
MHGVRAPYERAEVKHVAVYEAHLPVYSAVFLPLSF